MIQLNCVKCQQSYRVSDDYAGKKVRCKQCGTILQIPSAGAEKACADSVSAYNHLLQALAKEEKTAPGTELD